MISYWYYKGIWHQKASELKNYFIFLNASISEGVCTTNIEMIALGKFLVLKNHYSNLHLRMLIAKLHMITHQYRNALLELLDIIELDPKFSQSYFLFLQ